MTDPTTEPTWQIATPHTPKIPDFEGQDVKDTSLAITSASGLGIMDKVLRMDEMVRLYVEGRVVKVNHVVDEKSGNMTRVHVLKAIDCTIADWDVKP